MRCSTLKGTAGRNLQRPVRFRAARKAPIRTVAHQASDVQRPASRLAFGNAPSVNQVPPIQPIPGYNENSSVTTRWQLDALLVWQAVFKFAGDPVPTSLPALKHRATTSPHHRRSACANCCNHFRQRFPCAGSWLQSDDEHLTPRGFQEVS